MTRAKREPLARDIAWAAVVKALLASYGAVGVRVGRDLEQIREQMRRAVKAQLGESGVEGAGAMFEDWSRSGMESGGRLHLRLESYPLGHPAVAARVARVVRLMCPVGSRTVEVMAL